MHMESKMEPIKSLGVAIFFISLGLQIPVNASLVNALPLIEKLSRWDTLSGSEKLQLATVSDSVLVAYTVRVQDGAHACAGPPDGWPKYNL